MTINWEKIQNKWQNAWVKAELGKASVQKNKDKFMMIFAYPGISGFLHVGHMRGFSYTDAICRYERLKGKEVLFPVGTHASGNQAIAFANKVKNKDKDWIQYLLDNGCPNAKIKELANPQKIIEYFNEVYVNDYWKKFGFLCDWDRFTCTTFPDYEKFIQWQFKKLQQKDLLVQKPYFATACVIDGPVAVDPSETDISKGGNAEKQEFTLLKFKYGNDYFVAATLRPETIFGQTNLWVNPDAQYVRIEINREQWIVSKEAAEKLQHQKDNVVIKEDIAIKSFMGKEVLAPGIDKAIPILPASFCNPTVGTGIVTSVPSDAPYDYLALKYLQDHPAECKKYDINSAIIKKITLIPIIITKDFGPFPAKEIVEKLNIERLDDMLLETATKEVYKSGYHTGVMAEICGKYAGKKVEEAKELIKAELLQEQKADILHDLSEEVICRCGNKVVIKRIDDQWFIRYSDSELTERSKEQAREMKIYPQEYYDNLPAILEWFNDRACARLGNWLGSKLPFDKRWIVEPISDSTLYPAYYIVAKFVNNGTIKKEELTEEFFNYVFLGTGKAKDTWKPIKEEFDYFYPLDINLGGKEHKTVHFPVFIMNHVAIFPEEKWPRGIFVNWWVTGKGAKISKSKGGAEPIPNAIKKYGVDAMRLYYTHIGSPHVDVVWAEETVLHYKNALERIYTLIQETAQHTKTRIQLIDTWLISRLNHNIKKIDHALQRYDLREMASIVYFMMYDDLRWHTRRGGVNHKIIAEYVQSWCKLMNPITPHISEELNDSDELVSTSVWPRADETKTSVKAEAAEELVAETVEGIRNVLKLASIEKPKNITIYIAENWLYPLVTVIAKESKITRNIGEIMKKILGQEQLKDKGKEASNIVTILLKDVTKIPKIIISQEEESAVMNEAKKFLEIEFNCPIKIMMAENSTHQKAKSAMPGKVGIVVE